MKKTILALSLILGSTNAIADSIITKDIFNRIAEVERRYVCLKLENYTGKNGEEIKSAVSDLCTNPIILNEGANDALILLNELSQSSKKSKLNKVIQGLEKELAKARLRMETGTLEYEDIEGLFLGQAIITLLKSI